MTAQSLLAVLVALCSAVCYATAAALQRRETARAAVLPASEKGAPASVGGLAFFRALARRPWWWAGVVAMALGAAIHVVALGLGSVTLVQPIGVTALILALPLDAWLERRRILRLEWVGAAVLVVGLVGVFLLAPHHTHPTIPVGADALIAAGAVLALVALIVLSTTRAPLVARAVARAAASGICAGGVSGLVRVLFRMVQTGSPPLMIALVLAAAVVLPIGAVLLLQTAYRDGGLDAGMATQITVDQITAAAIGIIVIGERFTAGGLGAALAGLSAVVAVVGLVTLVRVSPRAGPGAELPGRGAPTPVPDARNVP